MGVAIAVLVIVIVCMLLPPGLFKGDTTADSTAVTPDSILNPVQRSLDGVLPMAEDSVPMPEMPDTTAQQVTADSFNDKPAVTNSGRTLDIREHGFNVLYKISANNGLLRCTATYDGREDKTDFPYNAYVSADKILDQFEGLIYYWAATETSKAVLGDDGKYDDAYMESTLNLLKKSMDALSAKRGDSPEAAERVRQTYNRLKTYRNPRDEISIKEIRETIFNMSANPIATRELQFQ